MIPCFFVSDLHGISDRYRKLTHTILIERPRAVFLGGDLFPTAMEVGSANGRTKADFINTVLIDGFCRIQDKLKADYPRVFLILGNDDPRSKEVDILEGEKRGVWEYISSKSAQMDEYRVYGYPYVPPSPFLLKDWEHYDVSRYVDPGCISPEGGWHSYPVPENESKYSTIELDLDELVSDNELSNAIFLFHTPPYQTTLDRADLDGKTYENVPLDVHVGSIAVRRFIEAHQPLITLHGHIHESPRLTGTWKDRIEKTYLFSAAHDGRELALVRFDPAEPEKATRELI